MTEAWILINPDTFGRITDLLNEHGYKRPETDEPTWWYHETECYVDNILIPRLGLKDQKWNDNETYPYKKDDHFKITDYGDEKLTHWYVLHVQASTSLAQRSLEQFMGWYKTEVCYGDPEGRIG